MVYIIEEILTIKMDMPSLETLIALLGSKTVLDIIRAIGSRKGRTIEELKQRDMIETVDYVPKLKDGIVDLIRN